MTRYRDETGALVPCPGGGRPTAWSSPAMCPECHDPEVRVTRVGRLRLHWALHDPAEIAQKFKRAATEGAS